MRLADKANDEARQRTDDRAMKRAFREQAIASGVADECVIDKDTYAEISDVSGCFRRNHLWIVYETDERSQVFNEKKHLSEMTAYRDLAGRLGFQFRVPKEDTARAAGIPDFSVGDTVRVYIRASQGGREHLQAFEGTVTAKRIGSGKETFTVRRTAYGIGVERTFQLHSPRVEHIEVVRRGKVRRAKLYHVRNLPGKAAKLKET